MAYKPIVFNTDMVKAILEGRKTQTRRLIRPHFRENEYGFQIITELHSGRYVRVEYIDGYEDVTRYMNEPCQPGDILWVREACHKDAGRYMYRANYAADERFFRNGREVQISWEPPIYMPKEAARLFLRVKDVRPERLQDISCHDVAAEGVDDAEPCYDDEILCNYCPLEDYEKGVHNYGSGPVMCEGARCKEAFDAWTEEFIAEFSTIWNSTIKPADLDKYGWDANPWVWVIEFERCGKPEGW